MSDTSMQIQHLASPGNALAGPFIFCYDNSALMAKCQTAGIQLALHGQLK